MAPQTQPGQAAATGAPVAATGAYAKGVAAGTVAAGALATGATVAAGAIVAALMSFLVQLRELHRRWLIEHLGRYSRSAGDIQGVVDEEMRKEALFAQASSDRVASALPDLLAIADPQSRATAVRQLLEAERRYAQQRTEAMAARAIAALDRVNLRRVSPMGAWWRLGRARNHTLGCKVMAGGAQEGDGRFWPWAVLDRVHPPRHFGCTSTLHSFGEAVKNGWMSAGDVPDEREAIRQAAGVLQEGEVDALLAEVELRERLVEGGMDPERLASLPWRGLAGDGHVIGSGLSEEETSGATAAVSEAARATARDSG